MLMKRKIPYIVGEAPSNLLLKKMKPSVWQSRIMLTWGVALCCHVAAYNKSGIFAARFFLGLVSQYVRPNMLIMLIRDRQAEAGMFPGVVLQMTYWYRPDEMSVRLLYFCGHSIPGQFWIYANWRQIS
jgi:hypothetical protein